MDQVKLIEMMSIATRIYPSILEMILFRFDLFWCLVIWNEVISVTGSIVNPMINGVTLLAFLPQDKLTNTCLSMASGLLAANGAGLPMAW